NNKTKPSNSTKTNIDSSDLDSAMDISTKLDKTDNLSQIKSNHSEEDSKCPMNTSPTINLPVLAKEIAKHSKK
ncbi:hypothetical protein, partial [Salmonella sp. s55004]|uniref:hypothetical protein n=1 Tax=Salmonella sp. s55004 TaxID=3159675 RepID=UPI00397F023F